MLAGVVVNLFLVLVAVQRLGFASTSKSFAIRSKAHVSWREFVIFGDQRKFGVALP